MSDMKIKENEFFRLLGNIKEFFEVAEISHNNYTKKLQQEIIEYVEKQEKVRILMTERTLYYSAYIEAKKSNAKCTNELYQNYIERKEMLKNLKG